MLDPIMAPRRVDAARRDRGIEAHLAHGARVRGTGLGKQREHKAHDIATAGDERRADTRANSRAAQHAEVRRGMYGDILDHDAPPPSGMRIPDSGAEGAPPDLGDAVLVKALMGGENEPAAVGIDEPEDAPRSAVYGERTLEDLLEGCVEIEHSGKPRAQLAETRVVEEGFGLVLHGVGGAPRDVARGSWLARARFNLGRRFQCAISRGWCAIVGSVCPVHFAIARDRGLIQRTVAWGQRRVAPGPRDLRENLTEGRSSIWHASLHSSQNEQTQCRREMSARLSLCGRSPRSFTDSCAAVACSTNRPDSVRWRSLLDIRAPTGARA